ncbi:kelch domain-containing protein 1-like [Gigantopelta aegis]|uniref:kelch domain-containing protein 1-like n=1 Tax=Gigantopelta aegis TaxID=1735272 RepID=UPI001B88803E|nr:kelch domain-containing protein 1-like [Gigantopelta aegis]
MASESSKNVVETLGNDICLSWKKLPCYFPCGEGHVSCELGGKIYAFGGVSQDGEELRESNDLFLFDPAAQNPSWTKLVVKGSPPPPRSAAGLAAVDNKLYLFGGLSHAFGWFDDLYRFDIDSRTWSVFNCEGQRPSARDKLQCAVVDKRIFFFGGFGPKSADADLEDDDDDDEEIEETGNQEGAEFGWFNDLFVLDTERNKWSQPVQMNLGVPTARAAHAMCRMGRDIVVFGGRGIDARQNDLHIYNTDTRKWQMDLKVEGRQPEPRSFHTISAVNNRLVVIGGRGLKNQHFSEIHIFDADTKQWLQPSVSGDVPSARGQHSAVVAGDSLVVCGGSANFSDEMMQCHNHFSDTYLVKTADVIKGGCTDKKPDTPVRNGLS